MKQRLDLHKCPQCGKEKMLELRKKRTNYPFGMKSKSRSSPSIKCVDKCTNVKISKGVNEQGHKVSKMKHCGYIMKWNIR
jgi:hypothetical protein